MSTRFRDAVVVISLTFVTCWRQMTNVRAVIKTIIQPIAHDHFAADTLETTDLSIAEIARHLGYGNQGNMTRAFKRWAGVPPGVYRKQRVANRSADNQQGTP